MARNVPPGTRDADMSPTPHHLHPLLKNNNPRCEGNGGFLLKQAACNFAISIATLSRNSVEVAVSLAENPVGDHPVPRVQGSPSRRG